MTAGTGEFVLADAAWMRGLRVPTKWRRTKVKYLVKSMRAGDTITAEQIEPSGDFPVYGANGGRGYTDRKTHEGTHILIGRQGALCGNVHLVSGAFWASEHAIVATPDSDSDPRWVAALLEMMNLGQYSTSAAQPGIGVGQIAPLPVYAPPLDEQRRIADYLDHETAQIDALIAKQEQLISGLRERRFGVIASETLRGVDPLHASPATVVSFAALGRGYSVTLGKMLDSTRNANSAEQILPYIRAANIQDDGLHLDDVNSMPFSATEARSLDLRAGDALVVEGGAVGTSIALMNDMPGWSFQKTINRLRSIGDWDSRFITYVLRTYRDIGVIDVVCNKSTIPHLTAEKLRAIRVPAPPASEQRRIADHLDEQTAKIDGLIAKAKEFIGLARERRAALITEAVTGRIDVSTGKPREGA